jgi:hypothetical protein
MAKTMQELVSMESPLEASLKSVGYKAPETKEQEKYIKEKAEADITESKGKTQAIEDFAKRKEEIYATPDLQKQKIEAFVPTPESGSDLAKLFALTTAITFFGGGSGRYSGMAAMGNLASAMDGYKKGRKDLFAQELKEYDKNMKSAMENNKIIEDKLKEYLDLATTDKDKALVKLAEIKALTARQGAAADIEKMTYKQLSEHAQKLAESKAKWIEHVQKMESDANLKKALLSMKAAQTGERRDEKILQAIGPALRNIAEQYPEGTAISLAGASPDDKKRVQGAYRAVEESEKVADFVARNPNAVGALAVAKNFLKVDAIKSLQSEDEATVAAGKSAIIDQQLDAGVQKGEISRDDAEAAKVLQKKLFALALADVQGSGQRGSVYLDRQFQNLYDQASRDTTLVKIIRERAEENNRNLKGYKLNVERHNNPELFPLVETRSVEDYMKERRPKTSVPDNVEKALKGKPDGTGARSGNKTYRVYGGVVKEVQE